MPGLVEELPDGVDLILSENIQPDEFKMRKYIKNSKQISNDELQNKINEIYNRLSKEEIQEEN